MVRDDLLVICHPTQKIIPPILTYALFNLRLYSIKQGFWFHNNPKIRSKMTFYFLINFPKIILLLHPGHSIASNAIILQYDNFFIS